MVSPLLVAVSVHCTAAMVSPPAGGGELMHCTATMVSPLLVAVSVHCNYGKSPADGGERALQLW